MRAACMSFVWWRNLVLQHSAYAHACMRIVLSFFVNTFDRACVYFVRTFFVAVTVAHGIFAPVRLQKEWRENKDAFKKRVQKCVRKSQESAWD